MVDVYDKKMRSSIMQKIRSKGNKSTELCLINLFKEHGITGWRRNYPVKGHPDFVFLDRRAAIFVDGCFWHGHTCRNTHPKENAEYWDKKRSRNILHDKKVTDSFNSRGWSVIRIWECELKKKNQYQTMLRLKEALNNKR